MTESSGMTVSRGEWAADPVSTEPATLLLVLRVNHNIEQLGGRRKTAGRGVHELDRNHVRSAYPGRDGPISSLASRPGDNHDAIADTRSGDRDSDFCGRIGSNRADRDGQGGSGRVSQEWDSVIASHDDTSSFFSRSRMPRARLLYSSASKPEFARSSCFADPTDLRSRSACSATDSTESADGAIGSSVFGLATKPGSGSAGVRAVERFCTQSCAAFVRLPNNGAICGRIAATSWLRRSSAEILSAWSVSAMREAAFIASAAARAS